MYDATSPRITIPATARHTFRVDPTFDGECEVSKYYIYTNCVWALAQRNSSLPEKHLKSSSIEIYICFVGTDSLPLSQIHISATPSRGIDEKFFRNLYSYLDDCQTQDIEPSVPQLLLFLDSAEVSLAFPGPGPVMRLLSWGLGVVVGRWIAGYVMGLKSTYEEYFDEEMVKRK